MNIEAGHGLAVQEKLANAEAVAKDIEQRRIKLQSFKGHKFYDDAEIDKDIKRCEELEAIFHKDISEEQNERHVMGQAAEYTFRSAMEKYAWLAENIKMLVTSQYDDYVRGIDSIAQIDLGPSKFEHLGFAVDFTTDPDKAGEKLRRTFDDLDQGRTAAVKYFQSEKTGMLKNFKVPRLVIGAGQESLERLSAYASEILNGSAISESVEQEIRNDPFKMVLLGEIQAQLSVFINRLKKVIEKANSENRSLIAIRAKNALQIHIQALQTVQHLTAQSEIEIKDIAKHVQGDRFAQAIGSALSLLSHTPIEFKAENPHSERT